MTLSIDESIQILKAEIIAQDWRLPQKRIEPLEEAFFCLKNRFRTRKNIHSILIMSDSVLKYLKKHGKTASPDFLEFLKEAMAHVVTMYEDSKFDPEKEKQLFKRVYGQFGRLKQKVKANKKKSEPNEDSQASRSASESSTLPTSGNDSSAEAHTN